MSTIGNMSGGVLTQRFVISRDELLQRARGGDFAGPGATRELYSGIVDEFERDSAVAANVDQLKNATRALGLEPVKPEVLARGEDARGEAKVDEQVRDQAIALDTLLSVLQYGEKSALSSQRAVFEIAQNPSVVGLRFDSGMLEVVVKDEAGKADVRSWFDRKATGPQAPLAGLALVLTQAVS